MLSPAVMCIVKKACPQHFNVGTQNYILNKYEHVARPKAALTCRAWTQVWMAGTHVCVQHYNF